MIFNCIKHIVLFMSRVVLIYFSRLISPTRDDDIVVEICIYNIIISSREKE